MEFWVPLALVPILFLAARATAQDTKESDCDAQLVPSATGPPAAWKRMYDESRLTHAARAGLSKRRSSMERHGTLHRLPDH